MLDDEQPEPPIDAKMFEQTQGLMRRGASHEVSRGSKERRSAHHRQKKSKRKQ